mmetsp:Transcript_26475/g.47700  ORF Transcript_26475/g.47700 Transcript_26475/m.47700 type:complete len:227 (-) Transcript_26475:1909-2589(-)
MTGMLVGEGVWETPKGWEKMRKAEQTDWGLRPWARVALTAGTSRRRSLRFLDPITLKHRTVPVGSRPALCGLPSRSLGQTQRVLLQLHLCRHLLWGLRRRRRENALGWGHHRCSLRCYPVLLLNNINSVLCHIELLPMECVLISAEGVWLCSVQRLLRVSPSSQHPLGQNPLLLREELLLCKLDTELGLLHIRHHLLLHEHLLLHQHVLVLVLRIGRREHRGHALQ